MGKILKPSITIKGTKEGLVFFLDDSRPFPTVLKELQYKLENNNASHIWDGPSMKVRIKLGKRQISKPEEIAIRDLFATKKNLMIQAFECEGAPYLVDHHPGIEMLVGTVRSGQVLTHTGDLLLLGDVNPGGSVQCTGSIYVLGSLRGLAHAGSKGDRTAIIAASVLRPTQLRITDVISRPPDSWEETEVGMRFSYLQDNQIIVDKMHHLVHVQPDKEWKETRNHSV